MNFNLFGDPPTVEQIGELRAAIRSNNRFEDSVGYKVLLACPIPVLDVVAGMTAYAVESAVKPDPLAPFEMVPGSAARPWPAETIAGQYAAKVRAQGRDLMECEVQALERASDVESTTRLVLNAASQSLQSAVADFFSSKKP
ncbi:hypothetical protein [Xenophilus azovorans]|uniref:hypothetical protein n=1 Tax=Xenophilus azovorans TaxID=151755 RepID=UPI000571AAF2|nr:hypothetical protein [Xenophilus azovorans]